MALVIRPISPNKPFKRLHQTYPDELDELAPAFTDGIPSDPVTGNQLPYRKHDADGFEIYSFGLNAKDNGCQSKESRHYHEQETHDDLLWTVQDQLKTVPSFSIENQNEGLQKRYGIITN